MPSPSSLSRGLPEATQASCSPHPPPQAPCSFLLLCPSSSFYRQQKPRQATWSSLPRRALTTCSRLQECWAAAAPLPLARLCLLPSFLEDPLISAGETEAGR